jgi:methyl-accepting chemotaxis protein
MQDVLRSNQRETDIDGEIRSASSEQSAGVSQIGQAVAEMDQATQRNAALVEESAAAAESLKQQATQLLQSVAVFKLGGDADQRIAATPAPMASAPPPAPTPVRVERRGPNRATNVTRPDFKTPRAAEPAKTGTDDGWESF